MSDQDIHEQKLALNYEVCRLPSVAVQGIGCELRRIVNTLTVPELEAMCQNGEKNLSPTEITPLMRKKSSKVDVTQFYSEFPELDNKYTKHLFYAVFAATLSALQVGFHTASLNVPSDIIRAQLKPGYVVSNREWSLIVSIFCIGGLIGSYISGQFADAKGRKTFLLYNNLLFLAGGALECLATNVEMMVVGRLLIGVGCGGVTVVCPLYLGEIGPVALRGTLGTIFQLALTTGILLVTILGRPLGAHWRWLLAIPIGIAIIQYLSAELLLETPPWLVAHYQTQEASRVLSLLRDQEVVFHIKHEQLPPGLVHLRFLRFKKIISLFTSARFRFSVTIVVVLHLAQQFSGINAVFYYSTSFFKQAHVEDHWLGSVLAAAVNVIATMAAAQLMDRVGRVVLLALSAFGMMISAIALTVILQQDKASEVHSSILGFIAIACVLLFVICFELGLGPIPWLITAEVFPAEQASTAVVVAGVINWTANFIVGLLFPFLNAALNQWSFLPFAGVCFLTFVFSIYAIPETRGKSLKQIQEEMGSIDFRTPIIHRPHHRPPPILT